MMLVQETAVSRSPVTSATIPIQYVDPNLTGDGLSAWETEYARIPADIRAEMSAWITDEAGLLVRFGYRIGNLSWLTDGVGYWPTFTSAVAGLYQSNQPTDLYMNSKRVAIRAYFGSSYSPLIHEFGHHIDQAFRRFRGIDTQWLPNTALRFHAPFSTTWQAVSPNIPSSLYGATNILEWIAEQWRCQIQGDGVMFLQLMGNSRVAADTIRAEWVSMFPSMPALSY